MPLLAKFQPSKLFYVAGRLCRPTKPLNANFARTTALRLFHCYVRAVLHGYGHRKPLTDNQFAAATTVNYLYFGFSATLRADFAQFRIGVDVQRQLNFRILGYQFAAPAFTVAPVTTHSRPPQPCTSGRGSVAAAFGFTSREYSVQYAVVVRNKSVSEKHVIVPAICTA